MDTNLLILLLSLFTLVAGIAAFLGVVSLRRELRLSQKAQEEHTNQTLQSLYYEMDKLRDAMQEDARQMSIYLSNTLSQLGQGQSALLESMQRQLITGTRSQEERLLQLRQTLEQSLTALRQENDRQLSEMRHTVDEKLTASLDKRLNESFAQVSQRLEQVYKGLGEMKALSSGVGDLKKVLSNVKTRGIWGEMQLGNLLSQMLTSTQYAQNVAVVPQATERVEYAVRLPGKDGSTVFLPIDSKFPQESYLRLIDASDSADKQQLESCRKALQTAIRTEAKRISDKYIQPPYTTDFAVMFLPTEGLYAEVMRDMDAVEAIQREQRVVIAGPSTFAALLNALQMGFRTLAIEERSGEVWKLLSTVKNDFEQFGDALEKTRHELRQASDSIDTAFTKTRRIQRHLGEVEKLDTPS